MRLIAVGLSLTVVLGGCGKKGPLYYPEMLVPAAPAGLETRQTGTAVRLSFQLPSKDLAGRAIAPLSGVRIMKRDEPAEQLPGCSSCLSDFSLFRTINLDTLQSGVQRYGNMLVLMDEDVTANRMYTYRASVVSAVEQEGALSAPAMVALKPVPPAPVVRMTSHPTELNLDFEVSVDGRNSLSGFNVYRTIQGQPYPYLPLNPVPVVEHRFVDFGLERSTTYVYRIRSVVLSAGGIVVESAPSNEVEGRLKDDE